MPTQHTIEAHFKVKADAAMGGQREARIEARTMELLAAAIAGPGSSGRERLEAPALARAIYRAVAAFPAAVAQATKEADG